MSRTRAEQGSDVKVLEICGQTSTSKILIGEELRNLEKHVQSQKAVVITDKNVNCLYHSQFPKYDVIELGTGETIKTLETVRFIYQKLIDLEVDRSSFIVGIGGGVVCDISGFAASTYMRGLDFGYVATTLLAQVDASVGGKTGVNFDGYKNMIGVFSQPRFVICDPELLKSLPQKEVRNGYAEIVKHALIGAPRLFDAIESELNKALRLEPRFMTKLIAESVAVKVEVVKKDEKEKNKRRKLNFGHTFGHAIEKITGACHGEAISLGMVIATDLSVRKGLLPENTADRIKDLLEKLGLPAKKEMDRAAVMEAVLKDKKKMGDRIHFVLIEDVGKSVIQLITIKELESLFYDLR